MGLLVIRYALLAAAGAAVSSPAISQTANQLTQQTEIPPNAVARIEQRLNALENENSDLRAELERLQAIVGQASTQNVAEAAPTPVHEAAAANPRNPDCAVSGKTPLQVARNPKSFASNCLGPIAEEKNRKGEVIRRYVDDKWNRFDSLGLGVQLVGAKADGVVEITPTYTRRRFQTRPASAGNDPAGQDYKSHYWKVRAGVRAPLDPGGEAATFADLTKFERASGLTGIFGLEWGDSRWTNETDITKLTGGALKAARQECFAEKQSESATDPLTGKGDPLRRYSDAEILRLCDGMPLIDWIANDKKRRQTYYGKMVKPIFGDYSGDAGSAQPVRWFLGAEGSYANSTYNFFPLSDPANTGVTLLTELPANFPSGQSQQKHDLYALKVYGGRGIGSQKIDNVTILEAGDLSASLTYRRDYTFVDGTSDQQICAPDGLVIRCHKRNIAPPYKTQGFIAGARLGMKFPSFGFMPTTAMELRGTYDFANDRYGLQVPFYLIANDKGEPNGGVMLSCTSKGRTESGLELERDCRGAIFVGTEFQLDRR